MIQNHAINESKIQLLPVTSRFDSIIELLDELHTAASEDRVETVANMSERELASLMRDVIYTAQETLAEIQDRKVYQTPRLCIVEKQVG